MENIIRKINYKSDFSFILNLEYLDSNGDKQELGFPDYSFTILLYTNNLKKYIVKYNKDTNTYTNCNNLEGKLQVVLNNHRLGKGRLHAELYSELPNDSFPDNSQLLVCPIELDIELVEDCQEPLTDADITFIAPYAKGDPLRWEDLTEEQKNYFIEQASSSLITLEEEVRQAEEERKNLFNESVTKSNESSNYAKSKGDEAVTIATEAANNANTKANLANSSAKKANTAYNNIMDPNGDFQQAEKDRQDAEKQREAEFNAQIGRIDKAVIDANSALSQADDLYKSIKDIPNEESQRVINENKRIENENTRIANEDNRILAEIDRNDKEQDRRAKEVIRQTQEDARQINTTAAIERVDTKLVEATNAINNVETATLRANESTAKANKAAEEADNAREGITEALDQKANINGSYPKMTAGFAQEIVGDGSATPEEFSFRPTAGEDRNVANTTYYDGERNGVARIEKIKGNSVVWNKPIKNKVDTTGTGRDGWYNRGGNAVSVTFDGDLITQVTTTSATNVQLSQNIGFKSNHIYYILWEWDYPEDTFTLQSDNEIRFRQISDRNGVSGVFISSTKEPKGFLQKLYTSTRDDLPFISIGLRLYSFLSNASYVFKNRIRVVDLTKMFGAGNEPTTVEEFWQRLPKGINISEYNEGTIIDGNYGAIKTTGFNQWDEQWELGGITTAAGQLFNTNTRIRSKNYNPALPNTSYVLSMPTGQPILIFWYDSNYQFISYNYSSAQSTSKISPSNARYFKILLYDTYGTTYNNDICINLAWDEYAFMNGMYQPYKPFERDLSWVANYFPNGMRSAGSVRDEIRFNSSTQKWEAVQNVGVRAYAEGDAEDTSVTTDGTNTNYALATPIVAEISEDVNLDFDVSDYGTEELIAQEGKASAPIVADISYAPNALSTLKQVPDILKRLKALESAVASATATTNEETVE